MLGTVDWLAKQVPKKLDLKKSLGQLLNPSKKKCWKIGTVELPIMFFGCFSWPKTLGPERSNIMDFIGFHWPPACRKKKHKIPILDTSRSEGHDSAKCILENEGKKWIRREQVFSWHLFGYKNLVKKGVFLSNFDDPSLIWSNGVKNSPLRHILKKISLR